MHNHEEDTYFLFLFAAVLVGEAKATWYYFLDDVSQWQLNFQGGPPNGSLTFDLGQTNAGIIGYSLSASGPFTATMQLTMNFDSLGNGSAQYYVKGVGLGETEGTTCLTGWGCTQNIPYGIAGVSTVELVQINSAIDTNPNTGGGSRYYPDKQSPSDSSVRKKVRVRATLTLPAPNFGVIFRSYDMDDPSSNASPVDSDTGGANTGADNRGANPNGIMSQVNQTGKTDTVTAISNGSGVAEADLWTTMHPGDNFMVASAAFTSILDGLTVNTANGTTLNDAGGNALPVDRAKASPLLTVWRKLNLEVDNMGAIGTNSQSGTVSAASHSGGNTVVTLSVTPDAGRYTPGTIKIHNTTYAVQSYSGNQVTVSGNLNINQTVNKSFTIWDDDDYDGDNNPDNGDESETSIGSLNALTNVTTSNVFAPAYITPVNNGGGGSFNGAATGAVNIANVSGTITSQLNSARGSTGSDEFWVSYIQIAYQGDVTQDLDPASETNLIGGVTPGPVGNSANANCSGLPTGGTGSLIFQESLRDVWALAGQSNDDLTVPHEIGHQFGLEGDASPGGPWGIMSEFNNPNFVPAHLHMLRCRVKSPGL